VPRTPKMSTPVTRQELRTELADLEARVNGKFEAVDRRFEAIEIRLDRCATRTDLEIWAGALEQRLEQRLDQRFTTAIATAIAASEQRLFAALEGVAQRLSSELASHTRAIEESMRSAVAAVDDKYPDLPRRVAALEHKVGV